MAAWIALTEKRSRRAEIQALWEQRHHTIGWLTELYNGKPFLKGERTYPSVADLHSRIDYLLYSFELQATYNTLLNCRGNLTFRLYGNGRFNRPERKTFPKGRNSSPLGTAAPHNRLAYRTIQQTSIPKGRKNLPFRSRPPFRNGLPAIHY